MRRHHLALRGSPTLIRLSNSLLMNMPSYLFQVRTYKRIHLPRLLRLPFRLWRTLGRPLLHLMAELALLVALVLVLLYGIRLTCPLGRI